MAFNVGTGELPTLAHTLTTELSLWFCFCFTVVGLFVATGPNRAEAALEFLILPPLLLQACANTAGFHFNTSFFLFCFVLKVPQMIPIGNQGGDPKLYQTDMVGHGDFSMTLLYVLQGIWRSSV